VAFFKYTMIFNFGSGINDTNQAPIRLGGWSESYYSATTSGTIDTSFVNLITVRLGICPRGTSVTRWRVQQLDPVGPSSLRRVQLSAPNTWLSDVPQMALKVPFQAGSGSSQFIREFRGIPDVQITSGEYTPTAPFNTALVGFLNSLRSSVFSALRRDRDQLQYRVQSISAQGVVVMIEPFVPVADGLRVQVIRSINPLTGRRFGYFATVRTNVDNSNFTIAGEKVKASNFGTIRVAASGLAGFGGPQINSIEAVVRKVGRPFKAYSGRASRRQ